jgi:hypothetical protein
MPQALAQSSTDGPAVKARDLALVFFGLLRAGVAGSAEALQVACVPKELSIPAMRDAMVRNGGKRNPARVRTVATIWMCSELGRPDPLPARGVVSRITQSTFQLRRTSRRDVRQKASSRSSQPARHARRLAPAGHGHCANRRPARCALKPSAWAMSHVICEMGASISHPLPCNRGRAPGSPPRGRSAPPAH